MNFDAWSHTDNLQCTIGIDFSDITRTEVSRAIDFSKVDVFVLGSTYIPCGDNFSTDENFTTWTRFVGISILSFFPIDQTDFTRNQWITCSAYSRIGFYSKKKNQSFNRSFNIENTNDQQSSLLHMFPSNHNPERASHQVPLAQNVVFHHWEQRRHTSW